ncbi:hypothetical protein EV126DRAFT_27104 [Verticillium dahliae]|nr:hypothetical protein EV126DRAFT_27104 [Verticillium dahliae]
MTRESSAMLRGWLPVEQPEGAKLYNSERKALGLNSERRGGRATDTRYVLLKGCVSFELRGRCLVFQSTLSLTGHLGIHVLGIFLIRHTASGLVCVPRVGPQSAGGELVRDMLSTMSLAKHHSTSQSHAVTRTWAELDLHERLSNVSRPVARLMKVACGC